MFPFLEYIKRMPQVIRTHQLSEIAMHAYINSESPSENCSRSRKNKRLYKPIK